MIGVNKKELGKMAASAAVCAIGSIAGFALMFLSNKMIDEKKEKESGQQ